MKNKLTSNLGWKLVSLIVSIILWLVVTTVSNPAVTQAYYNVPVKLVNTEKITDAGRVFEVLEGTNVIPKVTVKAPHSVISELKSENIVATADVNDISSLDTISINLHTSIYQDQITSIKGSIDTVKLDIQNKKTKTLAITADVGGNLPDGYMIGDFNMDQNLVRITGPETVIDSVTSARVSVDVSGFNTDIATNAEVKLYDSEEKPISDESITQNVRTVEVDVTILQSKEVPLVVQTFGDPAPGYCATGVIEKSKETVVVLGEEKTLEPITQIEIPKETVNITDQKENYVVSLNLKNYLPDGVTLVSPNDAMVDVTVYIEPESTKHVGLENGDVEIVNVPEGYKATIGMNDGTMVDLVGLSVNLSTVTKSSMNPIVDLEQWKNEMGFDEIKEGFYSAKVIFTLPNSVRVVDPIVVTLHIVKEE